MKTSDLAQYLTQVLQAERFNDYCPNGLQIEGVAEVNKIVTGVTASMALLEAAIAEKADAILVHHGYFWRGENPTITGVKQKRIKILLEQNINLFAYHLPLDAHVELGNNVMLGKVLGLQIKRYLDEKNMLPCAELASPVSLQSFAEDVGKRLRRAPQIIGNQQKMVKTVAWCTGAAQQYIEQAALAGADVFVSGEISEQTVHMALESGTAYIAAGHHATERYGICALGEHLAHKFGLEHVFIDIQNPV